MSNDQRKRLPAPASVNQGVAIFSARMPDVAVVISLNRFLAPVDDTVTVQLQSQVTSHKSSEKTRGSSEKIRVLYEAHHVYTLDMPSI